MGERGGGGEQPAKKKSALYFHRNPGGTGKKGSCSTEKKDLRAGNGECPRREEKRKKTARMLPCSRKKMTAKGLESSRSCAREEKRKLDSMLKIG